MLNESLQTTPHPANPTIASYDDRHGLWGGSLVVVYPDGNVTIEHHQRGGCKTDHHAQIDQTQVKQLFSLLEQFDFSPFDPNKPLKRFLVPDESTIRFSFQKEGSNKTAIKLGNDPAPDDWQQIVQVFHAIRDQILGDSR